MIVGLTGPNSAGKGVVARWLAARGYPVVSLSDVVRREAAARGLTLERDDLIAVGQALRREHGPGVLARRIVTGLPPRAVVDSIRSPAEVEVLRERPEFRLLGITAPAELRWRRARARGRVGDDVDFETFLAQEAQENVDRPDAQQLDRALALADHVLHNDGPLDRFLAELAAVVSAWEAADR